MKRIFRKNQIVVAALALLIAGAGYLNYTYENDEKDIKEYKVSEIKFKPKRRRNNINDELSDKEIRELEELERREGKSKLDDN